MPLKVIPCDATWPSLSKESDPELGIAAPGLAIATRSFVSAAHGRQTLRIGALDLQLATQVGEAEATPQSLRFELAPTTPGGRYRWEGTQVSLAWAVASALPGGQDRMAGEIYEDCEDAAAQSGACSQRREPPLVIPWRRPFSSQDDETKAKLLLRVRQRASRLDQQRIDLRLTVLAHEEAGDGAAVLLPPAPADALRAACDEGAANLDSAVVLDREPFLVAKVSFPRLGLLDDPAAGSEVAHWQNYEPGAAVWNIRFPQGRDFCLTLPPQAVGETMEKGHDLDEHLAADFRLSPPAVLAMRQSYFQQSFAEAPWNLRDLLSDPGRELPGAQLDHLQFELLYGLSCRIDYAAMRLAELNALVGDVQGPLPQLPAWRPAAPAAAGGAGDGSYALNAYDEARKRWRDTRRRTRQRLGIFELWDIARLATLELATGVTCWIRHAPLDAGSAGSRPGPAELLTVPPADFADPFTPADPVGGNPREAAKEPPLAGGATWGFESHNIFQAVMRPGPDGSWPRSNTAAANDLRLSTLGAYGHQMAAFDYFRTKILADAAMGRTWSYTLERIGRIGVWWNRCKHVIVYERTVLPSPQFAGDQSPLAGRAVVRKVEEYVELLENNRTYPDKPGVKPRATGFVTACTFSQDPNQVVRFHVRGDWGSEVGAIGWKVPLWQPGADPAIYPKPRVNLSVRASSNGESVPRQVTIADPENLFFYTDTQPPPKNAKDANVDLSDTDAWAPVEGIDFCDEARPQSAGESAFAGSALRPATAGDMTIPAGLRPCTFLLEANEHAVDLLAHRPGDPMGTALSSLTLCRAQLGDPTTLSKAMSGLRSQVVSAIESQIGSLPAQASQFDPTTWGGFDSLCAEAEKIATQAAGELRDGLGQAHAALKQVGESVDALVGRLDDEAAKGIAAGVQRLAAFPDHLLEQASITSKQLKDQLKDEVDNLAGQAKLLPSGAAYLGSVKAVLQLAIREAEAAQRSLKALGEAAASGLQAPLLPGLSQQLHVAIAALGAIGDHVRSMGDSGPSWSGGTGANAASAAPAGAPAANSAATARNLPLGIAARWAVAQLDLNRIGEAVDLAQATLASVESLRQQGTDEFRELVGVRLTRLAEMQEFFAGKLQSLQGFARQVEASLEAATSEQACLIGQFADDIKAAVGAAPDTVALSGLRDAWVSSAQGAGAALLEGLQDRLRQLRQANRTFFDKVEDVVPAAEAVVPAVQKLVRDQCTAFRSRATKLVAELSKELGDKLGADAKLAEVKAFLERQRDAFAARLDGELGQSVRISRQLLNQAEHTVSDSLALVRAFGQPPKVSGLAFDRPEIAFFFDPDHDPIGVTPVLAHAAQVVAAVEGLKPLGVTLPVLQIGTQLIPAALSRFDLSSILPNVAGISLEGLFSNLKMPSVDLSSGQIDDRIKVKHGLDPQSRQAWVSVTADFDIPGAQKLFALGPLAVQIDTPHFHAETRIEGGAGPGAAGPAGPVSRRVRGSLKGDWKLQIGGFELITFKATLLEFDEAGQLHFHIEPRNVQLAQALQFVNALLTSISPGGVTTRFDGDGVVSTLDLPIPDTQLGAFGFSGLRLGASLALRFGGDSGFNIGVSASLARRDAPFTLTIFILGGAGYLELGSRYYPATGKVAATADMAIAVSASLAIALGPIRGGVAVYVGVTASYNSALGGGLAVGLLFMVRGYVSVLAIASATIELSLTGKYQGGALIGTGSLDISIKICWCFTLEVHQSVTYTLGSAGSGSGASGALRQPQPVTRMARLGGGITVPEAPAAVLQGLDPAALASAIDDYFSMLVSCP
jgi:hypothetical protein